MAAIKVKAQSSPYLSEGDYDVKQVNELNFFDLSGAKAGTKGTSNKMYHAELHISKDGKKAQILTMFGPTGSVQRKDYRYFCEGGDAGKNIGDISVVEKEYEKLLKAKRKKGYKDIDVAQRSLGSDDAKKITKAVRLSNTSGITKNAKENNLHPETHRVISTLMGSTGSFVAKTLKCPLGQLSNKQIDAGRDKLDQAKKIVTKKTLSKVELSKLQDLTNSFYGLIPHNLGSGSRGKMTHLLLDTREKIDNKEYDLDTLLDAKAIGATLQSDSTYDQYLSLDTVFTYIEHNDSLFKWLDLMIQETKAKNHNHLGKITLLNAWDIQRKNEKDAFLKVVKKISMECGKQVIPSQMSELVRSRKDIDNKNLYRNANVIPLFHGTRTQNITGILKKGMLIRPSNAIITGAMYGNAIYWGKSTKSINYTNIKQSYWANGTDDRAFIFIGDCALGSQLIASGPSKYSAKNISPKHSVWAKGGKSGVINDEFMLYTTNQHNLRYLLEFSCQK